MRQIHEHRREAMRHRTTTMTLPRWTVGLLVVVLLLPGAISGCGGAGPVPTPTVPTVPTVPPTSTAGPPGLAYKGDPVVREPRGPLRTLDRSEDTGNDTVFSPICNLFSPRFLPSA